MTRFINAMDDDAVLLDNENPMDNSAFANGVILRQKLGLASSSASPLQTIGNANTEFNSYATRPQMNPLQPPCTIPGLSSARKSLATVKPQLPSFAEFLSLHSNNEQEDIQRQKKERRRIQVREASRRMRQRHQAELTNLREQVATLRAELEKKDMDHKQELAEKQVEIRELKQQTASPSFMLPQPLSSSIPVHSVDDHNNSESPKLSPKSSVRFIVE